VTGLWAYCAGCWSASSHLVSATSLGLAWTGTISGVWVLCSGCWSAYSHMVSATSPGSAWIGTYSTISGAWSLGSLLWLLVSLWPVSDQRKLTRLSLGRYNIWCLLAGLTALAAGQPPLT
jgi:hypothetical protein